MGAWDLWEVQCELSTQEGMQEVWHRLKRVHEGGMVMDCESV